MAELRSGCPACTPCTCVRSCAPRLRAERAPATPPLRVRAPCTVRPALSCADAKGERDRASHRSSSLSSSVDASDGARLRAFLRASPCVRAQPPLPPTSSFASLACADPPTRHKSNPLKKPTENERLWDERLRDAATQCHRVVASCPSRRALPQVAHRPIPGAVDDRRTCPPPRGVQAGPLWLWIGLPVLPAAVGLSPVERVDGRLASCHFLWRQLGLWQCVSSVPSRTVSRLFTCMSLLFTFTIPRFCVCETASPDIYMYLVTRLPPVVNAQRAISWI